MGDMGSRGGHMGASSTTGFSSADRATLALASEISGAFVQGGATFGSGTMVAAFEGLDWNDFRRLTQSGHV